VKLVYLVGFITKKALVTSSSLSFRLSVHMPTGRIFVKFYMRTFFGKAVEKI